MPSLLVVGATGLFGQAFMAEGKKQGLNVAGAARRDAGIAMDLSDKESIEDCDSLATFNRQTSLTVCISANSDVELVRGERDAGVALLVTEAPPEAHLDNPNLLVVSLESIRIEGGALSECTVTRPSTNPINTVAGPISTIFGEDLLEHWPCLILD